MLFDVMDLNVCPRKSRHRSLLNRVSCKGSRLQEDSTMSQRCASHGNGNEEVEVFDNDTRMACWFVARSTGRVRCFLPSMWTENG